MKTLMYALMMIAAFVALSACETHTTDSTRKNWDGSVTHDRTTVEQNHITGDTSVDQEHSRTR